MAIYQVTTKKFLEEQQTFSVPIKVLLSGT